MDIRSLLNTLTKLDTSIEEASPRDERRYALAQKQMANLEKAAQYTGDDPIVRQRMGLPPKLPSIDKWDGKMPKPVGEPDWFAKLGSGFNLDKDAQGNVTGATSKATSAQQQATATNKQLGQQSKMVSQLMPRIKALLNKADGKGLGKMARAVAPGESTDYDSIASNLVREFGYDEYFVEAEYKALDPQEEKELADLMNQIKDIDDPRVARITRRYQKWLKNKPAAGAATATPVADPKVDAKPLDPQSAQDNQEFSKDLDTILQLLQKKAGGSKPSAAPATTPATQS